MEGLALRDADTRVRQTGSQTIFGLFTVVLSTILLLLSRETDGDCNLVADQPSSAS
jgi:hypothetical protein